MARQKHPVVPTVVEPDPTVYVIETTGWHKPLPRVEERVQPISRGRERERLDIDTWRIDAAQPVIATIPLVRRVK